GLYPFFDLLERAQWQRVFLGEAIAATEQTIEALQRYPERATELKSLEDSLKKLTTPRYYDVKASVVRAAKLHLENTWWAGLNVILDVFNARVASQKIGDLFGADSDGTLVKIGLRGSSNPFFGIQSDGSIRYAQPHSNRFIPLPQDAAADLERDTDLSDQAGPTMEVAKLLAENPDREVLVVARPGSSPRGIFDVNGNIMLLPSGRGYWIVPGAGSKIIEIQSMPEHDMRGGNLAGFDHDQQEIIRGYLGDHAASGSRAGVSPSLTGVFDPIHLKLDLDKVENLGGIATDPLVWGNIPLDLEDEGTLNEFKRLTGLAGFSAKELFFEPGQTPRLVFAVDQMTDERYIPGLLFQLSPSREFVFIEFIDGTPIADYLTVLIMKTGEAIRFDPRRSVFRFPADYVLDAESGVFSLSSPTGLDGNEADARAGSDAGTQAKSEAAQLLAARIEALRRDSLNANVIFDDQHLSPGLADAVAAGEVDADKLIETTLALHYMVFQKLETIYRQFEEHGIDFGFDHIVFYYEPGDAEFMGQSQRQGPNGELQFAALFNLAHFMQRPEYLDPLMIEYGLLHEAGRNVVKAPLEDRVLDGHFVRYLGAELQDGYDHPVIGGLRFDFDRYEPLYEDHLQAVSEITANWFAFKFSGTDTAKVGLDAQFRHVYRVVADRAGALNPRLLANFVAMARLIGFDSPESRRAEAELNEDEQKFAADLLEFAKGLSLHDIGSRMAAHVDAAELGVYDAVLKGNYRDLSDAQLEFLQVFTARISQQGDFAVLWDERRLSVVNVEETAEGLLVLSIEGERVHAFNKTKALEALNEADQETLLAVDGLTDLLTMADEIRSAMLSGDKSLGQMTQDGLTAFRTSVQVPLGDLFDWESIQDSSERRAVSKLLLSTMRWAATSRWGREKTRFMIRYEDLTALPADMKAFWSEAIEKNPGFLSVGEASESEGIVINWMVDGQNGREGMINVNVKRVKRGEMPVWAWFIVDPLEALYAVVPNEGQGEAKAAEEFSQAHSGLEVVFSGLNKRYSNTFASAPERLRAYQKGLYTARQVMTVRIIPIAQFLQAARMMVSMVATAA
ncbi:MAG: hypothetical protein HQL11_04290, partial [Candidatus Omnitrophica bacterium]|nr:hypothetical protein [Candidatus Omnitrophota bacterium]